MSNPRETTRKGPGLEPSPQIIWWRRGRVELPVQKKLPRIYYKLSQLFSLIWPASADRVRPDQSITLSLPLSTSGQWHLNFAAPNPNPLRRGRVGCAAYLIRLRKRIQVRRLFFATCFTRAVAPQLAILQHTSPVEPTRPHLLQIAKCQLPPSSGGSPDFSFRLTANYRLSLVV